MTKDTIIEEYRKIKLEEELNKLMWGKYKLIKVEITYDINKTCRVILPVNKDRFSDFIKKELENFQKSREK